MKKRGNGEFESEDTKKLYADYQKHFQAAADKGLVELHGDDEDEDEEVKLAIAMSIDEMKKAETISMLNNEDEEIEEEIMRRAIAMSLLEN